MRHWLYLASVLLFTWPVLGVIWARHWRGLWPYRRLFVAMFGLSLVGAAIDYFALRWHAWHFEPSQNLGIYLGTALETYVFAVFVTLTIVSLTLVLADRTDTKTRG